MNDVGGIKGSEFGGLSPRDRSPFDEFPAVLAIEAGVDNYNLTGLKLWDLGNYEIIEQAGHSFVVGDAVKKSSVGINYVLAQANTASNSQAIGIVAAIGTGSNVDKFLVQYSGIVDIGQVSGGRYSSALNIGTTYYLSSVTAGGSVTTEPSQGEYRRPLFIAISATRAVILSEASRLQPVLPYETFNQSSPTLKVGDAVRKSGSTYVASQADAPGNASVAGIITAKSGNDYTVTFSGYADIGNVAGGTYTSAFSDNAVRFLSKSTAGAGESTAPGPDSIAVPLFVPISGTRVVLIGREPADSGPHNFYDFNQSSPSFQIGQAVRATPSGWVAAGVSSISDAQGVGIITRKSGNDYRISYGGVAKLGNVSGGMYTGNLTVGEVRYLAASGGSTSTAPSGGAIEKILFVPITADLALIRQDPPKSTSLGKSSVTTTVPASGATYTWTHGKGTPPDFVRVSLVRKNSAFVYNPSGIAASFTIAVGHELDHTGISSVVRGSENENFWQAFRVVSSANTVSVLAYYPVGLGWFFNYLGENGTTASAYYGNIGNASDYDLKIVATWL